MEVQPARSPPVQPKRGIRLNSGKFFPIRVSGPGCERDPEGLTPRANASCVVEYRANGGTFVVVTQDRVSTSPADKRHKRLIKDATLLKSLCVDLSL
jgi:hypothetical protein